MSHSHGLNRFLWVIVSFLSCGVFFTGVASDKGKKESSAQEVVRFYAAANGRTIIYDSQLPIEKKLPVKLDGTNGLEKAAQRAALRAELAKGGIAALEVGERFLFVVHPSKAKNLPQVPGLTAKRAPSEKGEILFSFENMPLNLVLDMYSELTQRKFNGELIYGNLFNMETPGQGLTRQEAIAGIEASLLLHNLRIVNGKDNSFTVAPVAKKN